MVPLALSRLHKRATSIGVKVIGISVDILRQQFFGGIQVTSNACSKNCRIGSKNVLQTM